MLTDKQFDMQYPRFSEAEFSHHYAAVRAIMQDADLAALVVYGAIESQEILYFSDFEVTREAMLVFPTENAPTLFIQMYNHVPTARRVASINDVRWGGPDTAAAVAANIQERGLAAQRIVSLQKTNAWAYKSANWFG